MFLVNGRWFKTLCKTVLSSDTFDVSISTEKHNIHACISDKCYFLSIDNYSFENDETLKTDFYFKRDFKNIKEFITKLDDVLSTFIATSIAEKHFHGNIDECITKILNNIKESKRETEDRVKRKAITTDNDMKEMFTEERATEKKHIECIKKFKEKADLNSSYGEVGELLTVYQFERLTKTLYKSLFKAIGLSETRKIPFIISNNMVFFNYNGTQYKYYPSQCKILKKCGKKYQRINWKDFADDNSPTDQKQALGRSPPFTPDIRSINIDKFKIKE